MLDTNLLPAEEKQSVKFDEFTRIVLVFFGMFVVLFLVSSILLLPAYIPTVMAKKDLQARLGEQQNALRKLGTSEKLQEMRNIKQGMETVKEFFAKSSKSSSLLSFFLDGAPAGINLTFLNMRKEGEVTIRGVAVTRKNLLDFEKILRDSGRFENIYSPPGNIIRESNLNFAIQAKLKPAHRF